MPSRTTFLTGFALGYVLGARAGRQRYEQISRAAKGFMSHPKVQQTAETLQSQAADLAGTAKEKVTDKVHGRSGDEHRKQDPYQNFDVVELPGTNAGNAGSSGRVGL